MRIYRAAWSISFANTVIKQFIRLTYLVPSGNATDDSALLDYSYEHNCVVTTKDSDFSTLFWLQNRPDKLLLISTGNIRNADLEALLAANFDQLITGLVENRFVELTREHIIVHA